jgi:hypothetical protein
MAVGAVSGLTSTSYLSGSGLGSGFNSLSGLYLPLSGSGSAFCSSFANSNLHQTKQVLTAGGIYSNYKTIHDMNTGTSGNIVLLWVWVLSFGFDFPQML